MHYYKDLDPQDVPSDLWRAGTAAAEEAARELGMPVPAVRWFEEADELRHDWADKRAELGHSRSLQNIVWVNVAQSLESALHTIRHESHHIFEYSTGVLPRLKGQITAVEYERAEQRAEMFARRESLESLGAEELLTSLSHFLSSF